MVDDVVLVCLDIDARVPLLSGSPEVSCDSDKRFRLIVYDVLLVWFDIDVRVSIFQVHQKLVVIQIRGSVLRSRTFIQTWGSPYT